MRKKAIELGTTLSQHCKPTLFYPNKSPPAMDNASTTLQQAKTMESYYTFHAKIYDLTRWTFLFGRQQLVKSLPFGRTDRFRLLDVGCGTGYNLALLQKNFPKAELYGIDVSKQMLDIARKKLGHERVQLVEAPYGPDLEWAQPFDCIVFSYSLSMMNPFWSKLLEQSMQDLRPEGVLAVADFHDSPFKGFKKWMGVNHVRMDGHLYEWLSQHLPNHEVQLKKGYAGIWEYLCFIGKKG